MFKDSSSEPRDINENEKSESKGAKSITNLSSDHKIKIDPKYEKEHPSVAYAMTVVQEMIKKKDADCLSKVGTQLPKKGLLEAYSIERFKGLLRHNYSMGIGVLETAQPYLKRIVAEVKERPGDMTSDQLKFLKHYLNVATFTQKAFQYINRSFYARRDVNAFYQEFREARVLLGQSIDKVKPGCDSATLKEHRGKLGAAWEKFVEHSIMSPSYKLSPGWEQTINGEIENYKRLANDLRSVLQECSRYDGIRNYQSALKKFQSVIPDLDHLSSSSVSLENLIRRWPTERQILLGAWSDLEQGLESGTFQTASQEQSDLARAIKASLEGTKKSAVRAASSQEQSDLDRAIAASLEGTKESTGGIIIKEKKTETKEGISVKVKEMFYAFAGNDEEKFEKMLRIANGIGIRKSDMMKYINNVRGIVENNADVPFSIGELSKVFEKWVQEKQGELGELEMLRLRIRGQMDATRDYLNVFGGIEKGVLIPLLASQGIIEKNYDTARGNADEALGTIQAMRAEELDGGTLRSIYLTLDHNNQELEKISRAIPIKLKEQAINTNESEEE